MSISLGILAGGKSRRYGSDKALIKINQQSFLEKIIENFKFYTHEIILSGSDTEYITNYTFVRDRFKNSGPMAGIYEILLTSNSTWTFIVAVDMPYIDIEVLKVLIDEIDDDKDIIYFNNKGQREPLCALYNKSVLPKIEVSLKNRHTKMTSFLTEVNSKEIIMPDFLNYKIKNINSKTDYYKYNTKAFAICGVKNSGKTTFIQELIREFLKRDRKISILKHDGHEFDFNDKDTDTALYREAGADQVAICSSRQFSYTEISNKVDFKINDAVKHFHGIDILILEGYKNSDFPKFEIIRKTVSENIASNRRNLLGVITDHEKQFHDHQFFFHDIKRFCNYIESLNHITVDNLLSCDRN